MSDRNHQRRVGCGRQRWIALLFALLVGTYVVNNDGVRGLDGNKGLATIQSIPTQSVTTTKPVFKSNLSQGFAEELEFNPLNSRAKSSLSKPTLTPKSLAVLDGKLNSPAKVISQQPEGTSSRSPSPREGRSVVGPPDSTGYVVLGGNRLFQLQPFAGFSGQDRADLVRNRINDFFQPNEVGRISDPQVETDLDANGQSIIRLFSRGSNTRERVTLLTVTRSDAAAALNSAASEVSVANVGEIARQWARRLEPALRAEWERRRAIQQSQQPLSIALGIVSVVAIGVMVFLGVKLGDRGLRHARNRSVEHFGEEWDFAIDFGAACCKWLLRGLAIGLAIHLSLEMLPVLGLFQQKLYRRISQAIHAVWSVFNRPLLPNSAVTVFSIVAFLILAILVFNVAKRLSHSLKLRLLERLVVDVGSRESIATVIKYGLTAFGVLITLPLLGIDFSSLALVAGAVGLGIGIGLQNLINNFISGIVMLFERPVQVGDFVEVDGLLGTIEYINLRATVVRTLDSINVIVPNSRFMESNVVSWSYRDSRCRLHIPVGVAYGSDTEAIKAALLKVATENPRVLKSPAPQVLFQGFGDSSLNFELLAWTMRPADQPVLISDLNFAIEAEFRQQGIEIPFPQRDLHVRTATALENILSPQSQNGYTPEGTHMQGEDT